ncbi:MAG: hypothetical protein IPH93_17660 [Saprospiraceae bacterium]|nr:hypothetical protein [Saprospiraceae bacterium]MBK7809762.1 hypothetical protein [Saprospiraceae bacterium]MBK9632127.1 hypothetical protein [Saprospiraceae bacterium]
MNKKYFLESVSTLLSVLTCLLIISSCSKEPDELKAPEKIDSSIKLIVTKNNVPSDNYTFGEISAITKFRPNANDIIVFKADKGVFSNNSNTYSVNVSSNDTTTAFLKYNKSDIVRVTATVFNKYSKEVFVTFLTSFPTQILVSPDSSNLQPLFTSKCFIKSKLTRQNGSVSEGLLTNYYDSTANSSGGSIGTFHNSTYSNSQGETTVEYWLQDTTYHGFVFIKNYIDTDTGRVIGLNKIYIR